MSINTEFLDFFGMKNCVKNASLAKLFNRRSRRNGCRHGSRRLGDRESVGNATRQSLRKVGRESTGFGRSQVMVTW